MHLPFGKVIKFAHTKPQEMRKAVFQFFGDTPPTSQEEELAIPLFGEWLIYDYQQTSGVTFMAEYCLFNPDKLDELTIKRLEEVFSSSIYSTFEIREAKSGKYIKLEDLYTGKIYTIWDKLGSSHGGEGSLNVRIAKTENRFYMVGSNPIFMPITHTERSKKIMRQVSGGAKLTIKDTWELVKSSNQKKDYPPEVTQPQLKKMRLKIQIKYEKLSKAYGCKLLFEVLIAVIYQEEHSDHFGDFWKMLIVEKGLPEKYLFDQNQLFQDIWNYFPHKILNGKSPVEMFNELKKT